MPRTFIVERRPLQGRRYRTEADDAAELRDVIEAMADVPRASTASIPDMLFYFRRLRGRLAGIADRLVVAEAAPVEPRQHRLPAPGPRAVADGVFKSGGGREQTRTITSRSGRSVRVLERGSKGPSRQMELIF